MWLDREEAVDSNSKLLLLINPTMAQWNLSKDKYNNLTWRQLWYRTQWALNAVSRKICLSLPVLITLQLLTIILVSLIKIILWVRLQHLAVNNNNNNKLNNNTHSLNLLLEQIMLNMGHLIIIKAVELHLINNNSKRRNLLVIVLYIAKT